MGWFTSLSKQQSKFSLSYPLGCRCGSRNVFAGSPQYPGLAQLHSRELHWKENFKKFNENCFVVVFFPLKFAMFFSDLTTTPASTRYTIGYRGSV